MLKIIRLLLLALVTAGLLVACGDSEPEQTSATEETMSGAPESAGKAMQAVEEQATTMASEAESSMAEAGDTAEAAAEQVAETAGDVKEEVAEGAGAAVDAAQAKTHVINAEARVFNPDIIHINPGDTIAWINMTSHNTVSVEGLIPEGAGHWRSKMGENLKVTLDAEGVYAYVCEPHIGFGMVGVIVVGAPTNLEAVKQYARENLEGPYRRIIGKLIKIEP